jgi:hypothetical protein
MTTPFQVPWHLRILRLFLPQAPGTETTLYRDMMAAVVAKIEYPYRLFLQEMEKKTNTSESELTANISIREVLTNDLFLRTPPPNSATPLSPKVYCRGSVPEMMLLFEAWELYVRSVVPPDRLIVFEIGKDSWGELCGALNVSIPRQHSGDSSPSIAFPFINTTSDYYTMMMGQRLLASLILVSLGLSSVLAVVLVWYCCCRSRRRLRDEACNGHTGSYDGYTGTSGCDGYSMSYDGYISGYGSGEEYHRETYHTTKED